MDAQETVSWHRLHPKPFRPTGNGRMRSRVRLRARTVECSRLLVCRFLRGQRRLGSPPRMTSARSTPITPVYHSIIRQNRPGGYMNSAGPSAADAPAARNPHAGGAYHTTSRCARSPIWPPEPIRARSPRPTPGPRAPNASPLSFARTAMAPILATESPANPYIIYRRQAAACIVPSAVRRPV